MSGIFGFIDPDHRLAPQTPSKMANALADGPECRAKWHVEPGVCIGVVDKGIFPGTSHVLVAPDGQRRAVFQGRILSLGERDAGLSNDLDTRRFLLEPMSNGQLRSAAGSFAAAVWNRPERSIELVGDRYGHYLTYFARSGRCTVFGSSIRAIIASGIVRAQLDEDALSLMLSIGELVGNMTLLRGIRTLPAGTRVWIDDNGMRAQRFWAYDFSRCDRRGGIARAAQEATVLFRRGVRKMCQAQGRVAVPLSGGLDSRLILASVPNPQEILSHTWGVAHCRDLRYAAKVAETLNSPHVEYMTNPLQLPVLAERGVWLTEGVCDLSDMHVLPYVDAVYQTAPVILEGLAGDVILGGNFTKNDWWHALGPTEAAHALWRWRFGMLDFQVGPRLLGKQRYADTVENARSLFVNGYQDYPGEAEMDRAMAFLMDNRVRRCSCTGALLFRRRVEVLFPFFDNAFFDYLAGVPHEWHYRHRLYIEVIRSHYPRMGAIPWQRTGLPARTGWPLRAASAVGHRLDRMLTHRLGWPDLFASKRVSEFDQHLRGPLHDYARNLLTDERTASRGWADGKELAQLLEQHRKGQNHGRLIGTILAIELFCRLYLDDFAGSVATHNFPVQNAIESDRVVSRSMLA